MANPFKEGDRVVVVFVDDGIVRIVRNGVVREVEGAGLRIACDDGEDVVSPYWYVDREESGAAKEGVGVPVVAEGGGAAVG